MGIRAILIWIIFSVSAEAKLPEEIVLQQFCPPASQIRPKIKYCTQNRFVVQAVNECQAWVNSLWVGVQGRVDANLAAIKAATNQQKLIKEGQGDFAASENALREVTWFTRRASDTIASYIKIMVDDPDLKSLKEASPCYTEAYTLLSSAVASLDKKSWEGLAAYKNSQLGRMVSEQNSKELNTSSLASGLKSGRNPAADGRESVGISHNSEISGTEKLKK